MLLPDDVFHMPDEKSPMHKWHGQKVFDVPMGVDTMREAVPVRKSDRVSLNILRRQYFGSPQRRVATISTAT